MKKQVKITTLILLLVLSLSLTSCYIMDIKTLLPSDDGKNDNNGDTYINVDGGDNLDITINPDTSNEIIAASKCLLSSVSIVANFENLGSSSLGSGVIYKLNKNAGDAYIITNFHVVYNKNANTLNKISSNIQVYLYGQDLPQYAIDAEYIGGSMNYDLAVLKIEASEVLIQSSATEIKFADSDEVAVLESAIAIGNPEGGMSATVGHVNVESEYVTMLGVDDVTVVKFRLIRIDTAVNSGNSGGGLFNAKGELIGIVNSKSVKTNVDNIGHAIPSNIVKGVTENIIYHCDGTALETVQKCTLGVTLEVLESKPEYNEQTGRVKIVEKIGVSEIAPTSLVKSYFKQGDVINSVTIDGVEKEVYRLHHVIDSMLNARVGSVVVFNVERNGQTMDLTINIVDQMVSSYK